MSLPRVTVIGSCTSQFVTVNSIPSSSTKHNLRAILPGTTTCSSSKNLFLEAKETITHEDCAQAVQHVINDAEAHVSWVDCFDRPEYELVVIPVDELNSDIKFDSLMSLMGQGG